MGFVTVGTENSKPVEFSFEGQDAPEPVVLILGYPLNGHCPEGRTSEHRIRSFAFPTAQWGSVLDETPDGPHSINGLRCRGAFVTPAIRSALRNLWSLCEKDLASGQLRRAAGFENLAEICRLVRAPRAPAKGGLAPWAERRCIELMHARLAEGINLEDLAAEVRLSVSHFARMFKQSVGVPPRTYLTRLRVEKACELLETTDLSVLEIALEVGYSSNQVLARVFLKQMRISPSDYRRAVREPVRSIAAR